MVKLSIQKYFISITFVCHKILNTILDKVYHDMLEVIIVCGKTCRCGQVLIIFAIFRRHEILSLVDITHGIVYTCFMYE